MGTLLIFMADLAGAAMMTVLLTWLGGMLVRLLSGDDPPGGGGGGGWRWRPHGPGPRPQPLRAHGRRDPTPTRPRGRLKLRR